MNNSIANSIARNTTIQFLQQLVTWGASFFLMLYLPRMLGPVKFGRLYLAEMIAAMALVLITYDGVFNIAKLVSRDRKHAADILVSSLGFRIFLWIASFTGMITFSLVAGYHPTVNTLLIIFGIEMLWKGARAVYFGVYLGFEITNYSAISAVSERIFVAGLSIAVLFLGGEEIEIAIIMSLGTLLSFFVSAHFMKNLIPAYKKIDWKKSRNLLRGGFPFLLWTIFGVVYYRIDTLMLSFLTPEAVVGWYGAAFKFYNILAFLPSIFSLAILPVLSKLHGKEEVALGYTTQKSINFILVTGIPISIFIYNFSPQIVSFFFGVEGYAPSILNLQIFSVGLLLLYIDMVLGTAIVACDRQRKLAIVSFFAIGVNVGLNFLLIPIAQNTTGNGGLGAAISTAATELFILIANIIILPRAIFDQSEPRIIYKTVSSGILMILALYVGMDYLSFLPWPIIGFLGLGIYVGCIFSLKTFTTNEISFFINFFRPTNIKSSLSIKKDDIP